MVILNSVHKSTLQKIWYTEICWPIRPRQLTEASPHSLSLPSGIEGLRLLLSRLRLMLFYGRALNRVHGGIALSSHQRRGWRFEYSLLPSEALYGTTKNRSHIIVAVIVLITYRGLEFVWNQSFFWAAASTSFVLD